MSVDPIITLRNVAVQRNRKRILDIKKLDIREGEHTAIIGPNGSGKSTLVQVLSQEAHPLWAPDCSVKLFGKDRWNILELRKHLGIVSESMHKLCDTAHPALDIVLSGFFSSIGLDFHHMVTDDMIRQAKTALDDQKMLHLASKPMRTLSSGENRRVLMARACVHNPRVLLFDEAVSNLDFPAKRSFREALEQFHATGKTLILVTHDLSDIIECIDRVVVLKDGLILADGNKKDVLTEEILSEAHATRIFINERDGRFNAWC
jgi:iron complex transport system ATP-binding protein